MVASLLLDPIAAQPLLAQASAKPEVAGVRDFVEYWSASRLLLTGGNPYSPSELMTVQQSVGWKDAAPLIMWNPPWTLSLTLPFGLLNFSLGQFLWLLVHLLIILISAKALWNVYGVSSSSARGAWFVALSFVPTIFVLIIGQISPIVLAGTTAFLVYERKHNWLALGAVLVFLSIKPHLLYLFWIALFLWIWRHRHSQVLLGGFVALVVTAVIPALFDAKIYSQYMALSSVKGVLKPLEWPAPTLRNVFPLLLGQTSGWLEIIPSVIGLVWLLFYWQRYKAHWQWAEHLPLILLVSVTTSFFAWTYDQVVLLPAIIEAAAWIKAAKTPWYRSWAAGCYVLINSTHLVMRFWFADEFWYVWLAPALLLNYIVYCWERRVTDLAPTP